VPLDKIIWFDKPTVLSFASFFYGITLAILSIATAVLAVKTAYYCMPFLGLSAAILIIIVSAKRASSTTYTLSSYGISKEQSFLTHHLAEIPFDKMSHINVSRDLLGKMFHFGTVTVNSASISFDELVLSGVREPEELRGLIFATREKALSN